MTWLLDRLLCIVKVGTDVIHERPQYSTSCSYEAVSSLLAILLASLEPLTEAQLHAVHSALYCGAPALSATQVIHLALLTAVVLLTCRCGICCPPWQSWWSPGATALSCASIPHSGQFVSYQYLQDFHLHNI